MRPGTVPKDAALTFNEKKKNVLKKDVERAKKQIKLATGQGLDPKTGKFLPKEGSVKFPKKEKKVLTDAESAYQMLQDLRHAYRTSVGQSGKRGRSRLVELMEADTEFKFMVKELMKIESALMSARVKKEEVSGVLNQRNFFVILKGLDDDRQILDSTQVDKTVDMKQISRAINPDENSYEPDEEESRNEPPEMMFKGNQSMEGE